MINRIKYQNLAESLDLESQDQWSREYWIKHQDRYYMDLLRIEKNSPGQKKILEIGSYPFQLTFLLKMLDYEVTGIDINPNRNKEFILEHDLNILLIDIENDDLGFENNTFDTVLLFELFEHLRVNPIDTLTKIFNIINVKGKLLLSTPNLYSIYNIGRFISGMGINNGYKEFEKLNTLGHMGHIREYSVQEMKDFLTHCGFVNIKVERFSIKTRINVSIGKSIKNLLTDIIEWVFPKVKTHLFISAEKPESMK